MTPDIGRPVPVGQLRRGTQLLATGPPLVGLDELGEQFLAGGLAEGGAAIALATDRDAASAAGAILADVPDESAASRLGVIDTTGMEPRGEGGYHAATVGSPADLTGLGMRLVEVLEAFAAEHGDVRVVLDSLSSLLAYNEFRRLYRFVDMVVTRMTTHDATGLVLSSDDVDPDQLERLQSLFDGRIELRETDDGQEYRRSGLRELDTDWRPVTDDEGSRDPVPARDRGRTAAGDAEEDLPIETERPESLQALIEAVRERGYTVTVCNHTGDEGSLADLRDYLAVHNVELRTAELDVEAPRDTAVLHRGPEPLAVSGVGPLRSAVRIEDSGTGAPAELDSPVRPELLDEIDRREYTVENGGKRRMVRISRLVESLALEAGRGTLHAGFQRLDRLSDEDVTRRLYERIADAGVAVHLYGTPGTVPTADRYLVHAGTEAELAEGWFVVFDGGGDPGRAAALVSGETSPEEYTGFWTYRPDVVGAVDEYLRSQYW